MAGLQAFGTHSTTSPSSNRSSTLGALDPSSLELQCHHFLAQGLASSTLICLARRSFMTSARSLEKFISLAPHARPTSGRCVSLRRFWPTLFNTQRSRFISLQFAHCILSKALRILWLIASGYNDYLEESRELKVMPPCYAFQLLMT